MDGKPPTVPGRVASGTVHGIVTVRRQPVLIGFRRFLPVLAATVFLLGLVVVFAAAGRDVVIAGVLALAGEASLQWVLGVIVRWAAAVDGPAHRDDGRRRVASSWPALTGRRGELPTVEVRSFDVVDVTGTRTKCELVGRPEPGAPTEGDVVHVHGRRRRDGVVAVRGLLADTGGRTRGRLDGRSAVVRAGYLASAVVSVVALLAVCWFAL